MDKEKTTAKAYKRSDRWIENGGTIVVVSALLTISWRAYTAGKIPFWSAWPGILGFAVVCAGIIVMAAGFALRDDEDSQGRADSDGDGDGDGGTNSRDQRHTERTPTGNS